MENDLRLIVTFPDRTELQVIKADELVDPQGDRDAVDQQPLYPEVNSNIYTTDNISATYDSAGNKTTFAAVPCAARGKTQAVTIFTGSSQANEGLLLGETTTTTLKCAEPGDWRNALIAFGEPYQFKYEFNKAYIPKGTRPTIGEWGS